VTLKNWSERPGAEHTDVAVIGRLNRELAGKIDEAIAFGFPLPPSLASGSRAAFPCGSRTAAAAYVAFLDSNLNRFLAAASKRPEIGSVNTVFRASVPRSMRRRRETKCSSKASASAASTRPCKHSWAGPISISSNRFGRQWRVYLQAEGDQREKQGDISRLLRRNGKGDMVPLSAVASTRRVFGPEFTNRFNL